MSKYASANAAGLLFTYAASPNRRQQSATSAGSNILTVRAIGGGGGGGADAECGCTRREVEHVRRTRNENTHRRSRRDTRPHQRRHLPSLRLRGVMSVSLRMERRWRVERRRDVQSVRLMIRLCGPKWSAMSQLWLGKNANGVPCAIARQPRVHPPSSHRAPDDDGRANAPNYPY